MKTPQITIATTTPDKYFKKYSKELLLDFCRQINNDPKPIQLGNKMIGITDNAITKTVIHKNRIKLVVQIDIPEQMLMKNVNCFFIPACDDPRSKKKGNFEVITEAKIVAICMVKEHYDSTIKPTVFQYKIGIDFYVLEGEFVDKDIVESLKLSRRPSYIYYSGDWTEEAVKKDAWDKGILKENLDIPFPPFAVAHDTEPSFTEFKNKIEKVWISHPLVSSESQKPKPTEKKLNA